MGVREAGRTPKWAIFAASATNFSEPPQGELRRITLPRTPVNKDEARGGAFGGRTPTGAAATPGDARGKRR